MAFFPTHIRFGPIQRLQSIRKIISDTLLDENDESVVFVTIWDCRTHVRMTSMTSSVERTDLDFKISVALLKSTHEYFSEVLRTYSSTFIKWVLNTYMSTSQAIIPYSILTGVLILNTRSMPAIGVCTWFDWLCSREKMKKAISWVWRASDISSYNWPTKQCFIYMYYLTIHC